MTKAFLAALLIGGLSLPGLAADLANAQVTLPYSELKALLERAEPVEVVRPPLSSSVNSAHYELDLSGEAVTGSAHFEVETFSAEWQLIPLLSGVARLTAVEPAAAHIVLRDGQYALLQHESGRTSVTLNFVVPWSDSEEKNFRLKLKRIDALVSTLAITKLPEGREVIVSDSTKAGPDYRLAAAGTLELGLESSASLTAAQKLDTLPRVQIVAAVVDSASSQLRVVPDGSVLSEMRYLISHKAPVTWNLALPAGSELLSFTVNGEPFAPVDRGEGRLGIDLPAGRGKATEIKLSYANRVEPLAPVSGRLELELPLTPLLIHDVQWQIDLPTGYELAALDGNVVAVDAVSNGSLRIRVRKELCRNERPSVQIFYRKPVQ